MIKSLKLALFLTVSLQTLAFATELTSDSAKDTPPYTLDETLSETYKLKGVIENPSSSIDNINESAPTTNNETADTLEVATPSTPTPPTEAEVPMISEEELAPKVITEKIPNGFIEKLITNEGLVLAEKKVINNKIVERVLNEYHPNLSLSRKIISKGDDDGSFYSEEYYPNGKKSSEAIFINSNTKLGIEKKYDTNGTLRQEIPWVEISPKSSKSNDERTSKREGILNTYYPNGKIAASFTVGKKGKNVFFSPEGTIIREILNAELLDFSKLDILEDCSDVVLELGLEELVELYEDEGDISYNKCGLPYKENFVYEINDNKGAKSVKISYDELGMIRRLTPYTNGYKNGLEQKFDAQGNITAEISYKDGIKEGYANGYFPTREVAFRKRYELGKVVGDLTCYFPNGNVAATIPYVDGKKEGLAKISSPEPQELTFKEDKLITTTPKNKTRTLISKLGLLPTNEKQCLQIGGKTAELDLLIEQKQASIENAMTIVKPEGCEDFSNFKSERSKYVCYHDGKLKASYPPAYNKGHYANLTYFDDKALKSYDIPYNKKQLQGIAKAYGPNNRIIKELSYNQGKLSDTSRTYYDNSEIKELYHTANNDEERLYNSYAKGGMLEFSLSYDKNQKQSAYINQKDKNKDIYINFYDGKLDQIKEVNSENPQSYIDYNLSLGEYSVYKDAELIKAGRICGYEEISEDIKVITPKPSVIPQSPIIKEEEVITAPKEGNLKQNEETPAIKEENNKQEPIAIEETSPTQSSDTTTPLDASLVPSDETQKQLKLKAQNIGPIEKPSIDDLNNVVAKEQVDIPQKEDNEKLSDTQKLYYPNGNIRKTIRTQNGRTEEIKEFSKTGLLLTDISYNKDHILIEKYYGTGEPRRKVQKDYKDNAVSSFISREDFYNTGSTRYKITAQKATLLFEDKNYTPKGTLKQLSTQNSPLTFVITEYDDNNQKIKETEIFGFNKLTKTFEDNNIKTLSLNNEKMPNTLSQNTTSLLEDNSKLYGDAGSLSSEFIQKQNTNLIKEFFNNGKLKTEIELLPTGEISVKGYDESGTIEKYAYLSADGKLHLEKPEVSIIPAYRERYWVDYNNPKWVENSDKYSITSIGLLNLDMISHILAELKMEVPEIIKKMYSLY